MMLTVRCVGWYCAHRVRLFEHILEGQQDTFQPQALPTSSALLGVYLLPHTLVCFTGLQRGNIAQVCSYDDFRQQSREVEAGQG